MLIKRFLILLMLSISSLSFCMGPNMGNDNAGAKRKAGNSIQRAEAASSSARARQDSDTEEDDIEYVCDKQFPDGVVCNRKFVVRKLLERHKNLPHDKYYKVCDCGATFMDEGTYLNHNSLCSNSSKRQKREKQEKVSSERSAASSSSAAAAAAASSDAEMEEGPQSELSYLLRAMEQEASDRESDQEFEEEAEENSDEELERCTKKYLDDNSQCEFEGTPKKVKLHGKTVQHISKNFKCPCNVKLVTINAFGKHIKSCDNAKAKEFVDKIEKAEINTRCPYCREIYGTISSLNTHKNGFCQKIPGAVPLKKPRKPTLAGAAQSGDILDYLASLQESQTDRCAVQFMDDDFECDFSASRGQVKNHRHESQHITKTYKCPSCSEVYKPINNFVNHLKSCKKCPKANALFKKIDEANIKQRCQKCRKIFAQVTTKINHNCNGLQSESVVDDEQNDSSNFGDIFDLVAAAQNQPNQPEQEHLKVRCDIKCLDDDSECQFEGSPNQVRVHKRIQQHVSQHFKCPCGDVSQRIDAYVKHLAECKKDPKARELFEKIDKTAILQRCNYCRDILSNNSNLRNHLKICANRPGASSSVSQGLEHVVDESAVGAAASSQQSAAKKYNCDLKFEADGSICGKPFPTNGSLRVHKQSLHITRDYNCPGCKASLGNTNSTMQHLKQCKPAEAIYKKMCEKNIPKCDKCGNYFANQNYQHTCRKDKKGQGSAASTDLVTAAPAPAPAAAASSAVQQRMLVDSVPAAIAQDASGVALAAVHVAQQDFRCDARYIADDSPCTAHFIDGKRLKVHKNRSNHISKDWSCPTCKNKVANNFFEHIETCGPESKVLFEKVKDLAVICKHCNKRLAKSNFSAHNKRCITNRAKNNPLSAAVVAYMGADSGGSSFDVDNTFMYDDAAPLGNPVVQQQAPVQPAAAAVPAPVHAAYMDLLYVQQFVDALEKKNKEATEELKAKVIEIIKKDSLTINQFLIDKFVQAIKDRNTELLGSLKPFIIDINRKSTSGETALEAAVKINSFLIRKFLTTNGAK